MRKSARVSQLVGGSVPHTIHQGLILGVRPQESNFYESLSFGVDGLSLTGPVRDQLRCAQADTLDR